MARQQRDLEREQRWRQHIQQQRVSGLTIRAYCQQHQLRLTAYDYWRQEIAKRDAASSASPKSTSATSATSATPAPKPPSQPQPAFVPVTLAASQPGRGALPEESAIEIHLGGDRSVRVSSGCDRALLAEVLTILSRPIGEGHGC